jgi:DNA-binding CsgD family transcriptional regulator
MVASSAIRSVDLQRLRDVTQAGHVSDSGGTLPASVLESLRTLIPCDQVTYEVIEPHERVWIETRDLVPEDFGANLDDGFFWDAFWSSPVCSYPQLTGDRHTVTRSSDFITGREFGSTMIGELFRVQDARFNLVLPLAAAGGVDHRIEFWRNGTRDFADRDVVLLDLLRPRLVEYERGLCAAATGAVLTERQIELLGFVAAGMTNRQLGRRLGISEGTVRRHLENIFERLGVSSRAAAAAYYVGLPVRRGTTRQLAGIGDPPRC